MLSRYRAVLNLQTFLYIEIIIFCWFLSSLSESSIQIGLILDFLEHFFCDDKVLPTP